VEKEEGWVRREEAGQKTKRVEVVVEEEEEEEEEKEQESWVGRRARGREGWVRHMTQVKKIRSFPFPLSFPPSLPPSFPPSLPTGSPPLPSRPRPSHSFFQPVVESVAGSSICCPRKDDQNPPSLSLPPSLPPYLQPSPLPHGHGPPTPPFYKCLCAGLVHPFAIIGEMTTTQAEGLREGGREGGME